MFLIDSHCHLDNLNYQTLHQNVISVINKARARDVKLLLTVCSNISSFHNMKTMIGHRNDVFFSCGIHPLYIDIPYDFNELHYLARTQNVIALGETGLDYYYRQDNKVHQQTVFCKHIQIARLLNKPIIIHTRNAIEDTITILRNEQVHECGGVLHCFTGDQIAAKAILDLGLYISFSGIVTFSNASALRESVRYVPLDRILAETDSPYLAPVPYRGQENQPAYLREIVECIATIKGISLIELATKMTTNFRCLFHVEI